jgi:hypothetical protein
MRGLPLFLFLFLPLLQEATPEMRVDVQSVEPNEVAVIRVTITNPSSADLLWNSVLRIEAAHPYFVLLQSEYVLSPQIKPGQTDIGELTFQAKREAEAGNYPLTVTLSGGVGVCEEGCTPYFIEKEISIKVIRNEPEIEVSHTVEGTKIVITIRNTGRGKAKSLVCDGVTIAVLPPGEYKEITLDKKSTFTIEYEDEYGKKDILSYRITEDNPEPESSLQVGLVVMGLVIGYLFKKSKKECS